MSSRAPDAGFQMSNRSAVRRSPASDRMPDSSRGRGCCTGFGRTSAGGGGTRVRGARGGGDGEELALEAHGVRTPAGLQGVEHLVEPPAAGARVDAGLLVLGVEAA